MTFTFEDELPPSEESSFTFETEDEPLGYFGNVARRVGERATELAGQLATGIDVAAEAAEEALPLGGFVFDEDSLLPRYASPDEFKEISDRGLPNIIAEGAESLKGMDFGSTPRHTWEEVKRHFSEEGAVSGMGEVLKYAGETGTASIPDMAFAILNLPTYVLTRSTEIGETRAANKGKDRADLVDIMEAAPFALGSAILERLGGKGILNAGQEAIEEVGKGALKEIAKGAGKAAATEAGTEFIQEGIIEYVGEKFGTGAKMDIAEAVDRGFAGLVAGSVYGGTGGAVTAGSRSVQRRQEAAESGADALGQELAASEGLSEDISADAELRSQLEPVLELSIEPTTRERLAAADQTGLPLAEPTPITDVDVAPPSTFTFEEEVVDERPQEKPSEAEAPTAEAPEPQIEPVEAPGEVTPDTAPDIVKISEATPDELVDANLFELIDTAKDHNKVVSTEFVADNFDSDTAAEFNALSNRKKDVWLDDNLSNDQESAIQDLYANESRLEDFARTINQFDGTSPQTLGRSISLWFKDVDRADFKESPEYAGIASALKYAKEEGWSPDDVLKAARSRAVEWAGADAKELFPRFFQEDVTTPKVPAMEAKKAELQVPSPPKKLEAPAPPPAKEVALKDIRIDTDMVTETGDTVRVSRNAEVVLKEVDTRIDSMKLLARCIRG